MRNLLLESMSARMFIFGVVAVLLGLAGILLEIALGLVHQGDMFAYGLYQVNTLAFSFGFGCACILMGGYLQYRMMKSSRTKEVVVA